MNFVHEENTTIVIFTEVQQSLENEGNRKGETISEETNLAMCGIPKRTEISKK